MTTLTYNEFKDLLQIMCLLESNKSKITYIVHRGEGIFEITVGDIAPPLSGTSITSLYKVIEGKVQRKNLSITMS